MVTHILKIIFFCEKLIKFSVTSQIPDSKFRYKNLLKIDTTYSLESSALKIRLYKNCIISLPLFITGMIEIEVC